jgi:hypothetical protein
MGQMRTDSGSNRFLSDVRMARPVNQSLLVASGKFFFGLANDLHCPVQLHRTVALRRG